MAVARQIFMLCGIRVYHPNSAVLGLFVPGSEQPRLERGRSSIGTDGLGWLTPGRTVRIRLALRIRMCCDTACAAALHLSAGKKKRHGHKTPEARGV